MTSNDYLDRMTEERKQYWVIVHNFILKRIKCCAPKLTLVGVNRLCVVILEARRAGEVRAS